MRRRRQRTGGGALGLIGHAGADADAGADAGADADAGAEALTKRR
jgi:hypothetical protein